MVSTSRNKIVFKYWSPPNGNNGFKENMNERIPFLLKRQSVATGRNKGFVQDIFPPDGKLLPVERIFEELEQNGFH